MKKFKPFSFIVLSFIIASCWPSVAQERKKVTLGYLLLGYEIPTSMVLEDVNMGRWVTADAVEDKIQAAFEKRFTNVRNSEWYGLSKKYRQFAVRFRYNNKCAVAVFTKGGYMFYSAFTVTEDQFPKENRKLIQSNFEGYTTVSITELNLDDRVLWLVELQDASFNKVYALLENETLTILNRYECQKIRYRKNHTAPYSNAEE